VDIKITNDGKTSTVTPAASLKAQHIHVPGDISSAAYFIAAGLIIPNSVITIKNVGINPTRDGILTVCKMMGADIKLSNVKNGVGEPVADITVSESTLHGCVIEGDIIPKLIDEIPIIAVMAAFAEGTTIIKDAQELKVKESNRIDVMSTNLSAMGVDVTPTDDGMIIKGGKPLHGATIDSKLDHRIAMSFAIAGGLADGETDILGAECVNISYPGFYEELYKLSR
jgi:3-phosphoshikimate 1-carboxyvinyltransferase